MMNRYDSYQESGIPWLGQVPSHWETWKITHAINLIGSGTTPKSDNEKYYEGEILWVTTSELRENFISDTKQKISSTAIKDYATLKIYPKNSVVMAMYGATIGRLGILEKEATVNQACCVFGNSNILHYKFLFYWLWHRRPILISLSNGGGQPNLNQDDLKKLKLPLPSYQEQTAIANYLDKKLEEIDALIRKQQTLLDKLAEQRAATITAAVTKGLNPDAPMKNSGVAWLGDVPEHWEICRFKFFAKANKGKIPDNIVHDEGNNLPKYLSMEYLRTGHATQFVDDAGAATIDENEILLLWDGSNAGEFIRSKKGVLSSTMAQIKLQKDADLNFTWYMCCVVERIIKGTTVGMGIPHVNNNELKNILLALPPLAEQTAIANHLDQATAGIDRLCDTVRQAVCRLQEYRAALISQAVTGKIKVV